ncbi:MAG: hypothetical protein CL920_23730 [Deltaproteobacteria bacterium]|nr:hypothetical protein [Deltaproteobacteria bacterium]
MSTQTNKQTDILTQFEAIGVDKEEALSMMSRLLYEIVSFEGGEYKGEKYLELPNPWGIDVDKSADKKLHCNHTFYDAGECPLASVKRIRAPSSEIKLLWSWRGINLEDEVEVLLDRFEVDKDNKREAIKALFVSLPQKADEVLFDGALLVENFSGVNSDHRGSDHCLLRLPFLSSVECASPTLRDFVDTLFLVKSHKFDRWYEMFSSCRVVGEDGYYTLTMGFDHGS